MFYYDVNLLLLAVSPLLNIMLVDWLANYYYYYYSRVFWVLTYSHAHDKYHKKLLKMESSVL